METKKFIIDLTFVTLYAIVLLIDIAFGITSFNEQHYKTSMIQFFCHGFAFKILFDGIVDLFK